MTQKRDSRLYFPRECIDTRRAFWYIVCAFGV